MRIAIVTTGDEIMSGNVVDTNSSWMADKCWMLGHNVVWHIAVPDNVEDIGEACRLAAERADAVFVSGGLGATVDDITLESAAKSFGKKMVFHDEIWSDIQSFFKKSNRECSENNKRQAYLPEEAIALKNTVGTAPGVRVKFNNSTFFFLPGVPKELYQIFNNWIIPWLEKEGEGIGYSQRFLRCFGIPEASLDERLKGISLGDVRMSFRVTFPEVKIKLVVRGKAADSELNRVENEIREKIDEYIFGVDDETLPAVIGNLLKAKKKRVAIAESCTGGLISNLITNISGSSEWFERGVVCYSNGSKIEMLSVSKSTIAKYGAVSKECAGEMARGILKISGADFGLAVTGIAGPTGGTDAKPLGTVHIALALKDEIIYAHHICPRDREFFKILTAYTSLDMLRRSLLKI